MPKGRVAVDHERDQAIWSLSKEDILCVALGEKVVSDPFGVLGHTCTLWCYPHGADRDGEARIHLYVREPGRVTYEVGIVGGGKSLRCEHDFDGQKCSGAVCLARTSGPGLEIRLRLLEVGDEALTRHFLWGERGPQNIRLLWERAGKIRKSLKHLESDVQVAQDDKERLKEALQVKEAQQQSLRAAKQETDKVVSELLKVLEQSHRESAARDLRRRKAAELIQRVWHGAKVRLAIRRQKNEVLRRHRYEKALLNISKFQALWRQRQRRLDIRRQVFNEPSVKERRPFTKYDAVVAFQSLSEFISTGRIELLQAAESKFDVAKEARYRIVAVVGLFDKGKTFLINRLFGCNLPAGKLFTTKGLSFLWLASRRMLVLDSAGVQSTVSYRAQAVQPILDAQTTESLIFEMVSRISHHVIFVVNDLTWFEQKYIAMLHQKYVQTREWKELIVVHNLRSTGIVEEALHLFKRQIMQCYDGEPSHLGDLVFTADQGHDAPQVHHVGICDEATAAGERFNKKNCGLVLQMLELREMLGSSISLVELLQKEFVRLLPKFLNVELISPDSPNRDAAVSAGAPRAQSSQIIVEYAPLGAPPNGDGYRKAGTMEMRTSLPGYRVTMKTRGVISPLGEIIAHDVSFEPIVNIYDRRSEHEVRRFIEVECPGVLEDDIQWEELPNGVRIAITKRPAIDETAVHPVFPIRQNHGQWERDFHFDAVEGRFELCSSEDFKLEGGVLTVVLRRALATRKGKLGRGIGPARNQEPGSPTSPGPLSPSGLSSGALSPNVLSPARASGLEGASPRAFA